MIVNRANKVRSIYSGIVLNHTEPRGSVDDHMVHLGDCCVRNFTVLLPHECGCILHESKQSETAFFSSLTGRHLVLPPCAPSLQTWMYIPVDGAGRRAATGDVQRREAQADGEGVPRKLRYPTALPQRFIGHNSIQPTYFGTLVQESFQSAF